jgi:signal peptidase I
MTLSKKLVINFDKNLKEVIDRIKIKDSEDPRILKDKIYIVEGYNENEGAAKCEKYNSDDNKVYLINSLNERSYIYTCLSFKDRVYIQVRGGSSTTYTLK